MVIVPIGSWHRRAVLRTCMVILALATTATFLTACDPTDGAVTGVVIDELSNPLVGVAVELQDPITGDVVGSTDTDATGTYVVGVTPGTYAIRFLATGYAPEWWSDQRSLAAGSTIVVTEGVVVPSVDAQLEPTVGLAGEVTNGFAPLAGINVYAEQPASPGVPVASTVTGADGSFSMRDLPAGSLMLRMDDPGYVPATSGYRPEYSETASDLTPASATIYTLAAGDIGDAGSTVLAGSDCDPVVFYAGANLAGANLAGNDLRGCDLTSAILTTTDLTGTDLTGALVGGGQLAGADVTGATLKGTDLSTATGFPTVTGLLTTLPNSWAGIKLNGSDVDLTSGGLASGDVVEAALDGLDLTGANLGDTSLTGASLVGTILANATLDGADLTGGTFTGADLSGATLTGAYIAGADFSATDLTTADLTGANLITPDFTGANLTGATVLPGDLISPIWESTTCPDGTSSTASVPETCDGHL